MEIRRFFLALLTLNSHLPSSLANQEYESIFRGYLPPLGGYQQASDGYQSQHHEYSQVANEYQRTADGYESVPNGYPRPPHGYPARKGLEIVHQWKYLDWVPPNVQLVGNNFTLGNAFTHDVDVDRIGRVFVSSPKWPQGVPIVLSTVTNLQGPGGPLLLPYPDWTWHKGNDCNNMVTSYRMAIDECDRLWVVDNGRISGQSVCPGKILIFDLTTDRLIHKYIIPSDQTFDGAASLVTPVVEIVGESCLDSFLYIADVDLNGLVVYDLRHDFSWRYNNTKGNAFGPDDEAMMITIAGESFNLTDGTLGLALSPKGFFDQRYLYFNSLASFYQKFTSTRDLKESGPNGPQIFQSKQRRLSQAGAHAISRHGVMFFPLVEYTSLACWNIERPFTSENVVTLVTDEATLQYISGIKVKVNAQGEEEVWFNTNRLQKTINMTLRPNETNFRVIKGKVNDLIKGTRCEPSGHRHAAPDISSWRPV